MDCPVKFGAKKIFRFTKYNLLNDTKNIREKMNKAVKGDILKFSKSGRLIDDLGTLQYLASFPNENGHKFHDTGETASIIQPIDERVADLKKQWMKNGDALFQPYIKQSFEEEEINLMKGVFHIFHTFYIFILFLAVSKMIQK